MATANPTGFENIREMFGHFRILIIGRANAGKTTILRAICNSTEDPEVYDGDGEKIDLSQVEGTTGRGLHDIENELVFRSNDNFVFHDSQGFEAGGVEEFRRMKEFIADRAKTTFLRKRIHAIWYCIPMDKLDRAIQFSEEWFFKECDPGNIPVVVLFTKFDALLTVAMGHLTGGDRKLPRDEKVAKAQLLIEGIFDEADVWGRLSRMKHAPKSCVRIEGMDKSTKGCNIILDNTAKALDEDALQMLFVAAQQTNVALCVRYAVQDMIKDVNKAYKSMLPVQNKIEPWRLARWFPQFWDSTTVDCATVSYALWDIFDIDDCMSVLYPAASHRL